MSARVSAQCDEGHRRLGCSVLKRHAYKIATLPNDLAPANIMKIIESHFKVQGQNVEFVQFNSRTAIRYIADVAGKYAALFIKKRSARSSRLSFGRSIFVRP